MQANETGMDMNPLVRIWRFYFGPQKYSIDDWGRVHVNPVILCAHIRQLLKDIRNGR